MSLFLIQLYSEDVRKKRSEVGEEYGFRLQGKYVQKLSFVYSAPPPAPQLWNSLRHLETLKYCYILTSVS